MCRTCTSTSPYSIREEATQVAIRKWGRSQRVTGPFLLVQERTRGQASFLAGGPGGVSVNGGNGGAGGFDANNATAGVQPGGGGGGSETGDSGAGADGQIIVTTW